MSVNRQPSDEISCLAAAMGAWTSSAPLATTGILPLEHTSILGVAIIVGAQVNAETGTIVLVKSAATNLSSPTVLKTITTTLHADDNDDTVYFFDWTSEMHDEDLPYIGLSMSADADAGNVGALLMLGNSVRTGGAARHNLAAFMTNASAIPTNCIGVAP